MVLVDIRLVINMLQQFVVQHVAEQIRKKSTQVEFGFCRCYQTLLKQPELLRLYRIIPINDKNT